MAYMAKTTKQTRLNISPEAAEILAEMKAETGISHQRLVSRLVEWFKELEDDELRAAIISPMPKSLRRLIARQVADRMATVPDGGSPDRPTPLEVRRRQSKESKPKQKK